MPANGRWDLIRRLKVNIVVRFYYFFFVTLSAPWFGLSMESNDLTKNAKFVSQRHIATPMAI